GRAVLEADRIDLDLLDMCTGACLHAADQAHGTRDDLERGVAHGTPDQLLEVEAWIVDAAADWQREVDVTVAVLHQRGDHAERQAETRLRLIVAVARVARVIHWQDPQVEPGLFDDARLPRAGQQFSEGWIPLVLDPGSSLSPFHYF